MTRRRVCFIGITPLGMVPLMRYIVQRFSDCEVSVDTIHIGSAYRFDQAGMQHNIASYQDVASFNNHTFLNKVKKTAGLIRSLGRVVLHNPDSIIYTVDFQVAAILIWIKKYWKPKLRIIYHQFEAFEPGHDTGITRRLQQYVLHHADHIELAVFPEKNRMRFFTSHINGHALNTILVPNSNNLPEQVPMDMSRLSDKKGTIVIAHVGNLGNVHYTHSFFEYIRLNTQPHFRFLFIGPADEAALAQLQKLAKYDKRVEIIGTLPHHELLQYYSVIDIGVILYRGIDFNHENCAPNKLYEYWSQGIPVLAHQLQGLKDVWSHACMGRLVDMENIESIRKGLDDIVSELPVMSVQLRNWFEREGKLDIHLNLLHDKILAN